MEIINFFERTDQSVWLDKIGSCDWSAARFLVELLQTGRFEDMLGGWGQLFLLIDGDNLVSFATLTGQDAVRDESMTPWVGFVFTSPAYRGHRYVGQLLAHAEAYAAKLGYPKLYISTDHVGLYEKYGFFYLENRDDLWGNDNQVFYKQL